MTVTWVIDDIIAERAPQYTGLPTLAEAALEAGHRVHRCRYIPIERNLQPFPGLKRVPQSVIWHGAYEGLRAFRRIAEGSQWMPIAYCREERLSFSTFAAYLGGFLLSEDFTILPYGELKRRGVDWVRGRFGAHVFVRPNVVTKLFAGRAISADDFDHEINAMNQVERVPDEALVVVAPRQPILGEARFIIADGKVVTGSTYQWAGALDIRPDVMPAQQALAETIAAHHWQADSVYVADIAVTTRFPNGDGGVCYGGARLIELNAFSCAGLYACDTRKIVEAVGAAALKEAGGLD